MQKITELASLKNRTALITGATGHIGRVMAHTLAELKADLILCDLDSTALSELADKIQSDFDARPEWRK